jgi:hypothetical protein
VQPPQNQTVNPGSSATLSVQASGYAPLSYQWRFNGVDIPDANGSTIALSNATLAMDGFYSVRVSNGYSAVLSLPGRMAVNTAGLQPFYLADFEGTAGSEWSKRSTDATPVGGRRFLGQFTNEAVRLTLTNLPPHTNITIACDLFVIRSWDGSSTFAPWNLDSWTLGIVGGPVLLETTFNNIPSSYTADNGQHFRSGQAYPGTWPGGSYPMLTGAVETNSLGYIFDERPDTSWIGSMDAVYHLVYTIADQRGNLGFDFAAALQNPPFSTISGIPDESWGLDNVKVYLDNGTVAGWPVIVGQPVEQTAVPGATTSFSVQASGSAPLTFQWRFNGVNIPGATGVRLNLTNINLANDGFYTVRVANSYGSVLSELARLGVDASSLPAFYVNDFEGGAGSEWSSRSTELTPLSGRRFLGQFASQIVRLHLSDLPRHTNLAVSCDLFVIRSWNGNIVDTQGPDTWSLGLQSGPTLLRTSFNNIPEPMLGNYFTTGQAYPDSFPGATNANRTGAVETNSLGYPMDFSPTYAWNGPLDTVYHLAYSAAHTNADVVLEFAGSLITDNAASPISDESWGLDNVKVYLDNGAVAGWPVAFNPSSLSVTNGQFHLKLTEVHGAGAIVLEASTDLQHWDAIATNTPINRAVDLAIPVGAHPHRFFRAKQ